jgi:hypothetical protein
MIAQPGRRRPAMARRIPIELNKGQILGNEHL